MLYVFMCNYNCTHTFYVIFSFGKQQIRVHKDANLKMVYNFINAKRER